MTRFPIAAAWRETVRLTRRDLGTYLTLAGAFVMLPMMVVEVFGPQMPTKLADIPPSLLLVQGVLALIGALAQLSVARLVIVGGGARPALVHAAMVLPRLAIAAILTSLVLVPAVLLVQAGMRSQQVLVLFGLALLIPGIYGIARLALALPVLASRTVGPVAALQLSWVATAGNAGRVLGFLGLMIAAMLGLTILAGGVASALGSVLTLMGGKALASFVVALVSAAVATVYSVFNSVGLAVIYRRLIG
ncbi:hypothetical protein [Glacieibacterium sp.]|uniref:hypothetical protein n=1 Tax=Glacieibacterium sp. TaxID=2860237 RepID=UPI003AFF676D